MSAWSIFVLFNLSVSSSDI